MRFPYHQIDDDRIEPMGSIQDDAERALGLGADDQTFCPSRQLLPKWPSWSGACQIFLGFLCLGFGAVEVFVLPFTISVKAHWSLSVLNSYGAVQWSGVMLILSGSCAVRASKTKKLSSIQGFYTLTVFTFLFNLAMMILILWSFRELLVHLQQCNFTDLKEICNSEMMIQIIKEYSLISLLGAVCCLLGCMVLVVTVTNYFMSVCFGEVQLLKFYGVCCCPCIFQHPPSQASSHQSVNSNDSNMIV